MKLSEALGLAIIGVAAYYVVTSTGEASGGYGGSGGYSGGFSWPRITIAPEFPIKFEPQLNYPSIFFPDYSRFTEGMPLAEKVKEMGQALAVTGEKIKRISGKGGEYYFWGGGGWIPYEQRPWSEILAESKFYAEHPETAALLAGGKTKELVPTVQIDFFDNLKRIFGRGFSEWAYRGVTKSLKLTVGERLGGAISGGVLKITTGEFRPFGNIPAGGTSGVGFGGVKVAKAAPLGPAWEFKPEVYMQRAAGGGGYSRGYYSGGRGYYSPEALRGLAGSSRAVGAGAGAPSVPAGVSLPPTPTIAPVSVPTGGTAPIGPLAPPPSGGDPVVGAVKKVYNWFRSHL